MKREVHCSHNKPISTCREHWLHFCEVTGNTIEDRAMRWALGDHTGTSSKTLCKFMIGSPIDWHNSPPSDAADRGRCIRLLRQIPEWIERLDELKQLDKGTISINGGPAIPRADDIHSWTQQIPLIIKEGEFDYA